MSDVNHKKPPAKRLILILAAVAIVAAVVVAVLIAPNKKDTGQSQEPTGTLAQATGQETESEQETPQGEEPTEGPMIALPTKYIVLSYPTELQQDIKATCEDRKDGQEVTFTTDFTGEELELFQFIISKSESAGYQLGVLADEQAGDLYVCVNVHEYTSGNWAVEDYNKLNDLQMRVNDIIMQFHEDPRFTPSKP